jgi:hypothetical protein
MEIHDPKPFFTDLELSTIWLKIVDNLWITFFGKSVGFRFFATTLSVGAVSTR